VKSARFFPCMLEFILRPAVREDARTIRQMIFAERLNPFSLNWRHFTLAEDPNGNVAGCIQVKTHGDGTRELASLVVRAEFRRQGLARQMIEAILAREEGPIYLTCRASLAPFYNRFGFNTLADPDLSPYFRRLRRAFRFLQRLTRLPEDLAVMRR
jgi:N-acetylglutamate synthase-like GNAT family acetyltransferase